LNQILRRQTSRSHYGSKVPAVTQFDLENYLCADVSKKYISTFVKIRISNSNLNIEKGRYLNTPAEDRICKLCNSGVEDEFHFYYYMFKITILS
jgi:hypothetical protein